MGAVYNLILEPNSIVDHHRLLCGRTLCHLRFVLLKLLGPVDALSLGAMLKKQTIDS